MRKLILVGSILFYTSCVFANNYRGIIVAHVVESNGHVYRAYQGFENSGVFEKKQYLKFHQERGQTVNFTRKNILFDTKNQNKYHLTLEILSQKDELFNAELKLFLNTMEYDQKAQKKVLVSQLIKTGQVSGTLNSDNKFQFIDDNQVNLKLAMNIDKVFTKDELKARLEKYLQK